jgi:hypothetical protein
MGSTTEHLCIERYNIKNTGHLSEERQLCAGRRSARPNVAPFRFRLVSDWPSGKGKFRRGEKFPGARAGGCLHAHAICDRHQVTGKGQGGGTFREIALFPRALESFTQQSFFAGTIFRQRLRNVLFCA